MNHHAQIKNTLLKQLKTNHHLIGVAAGSGATAKYAEQGGADLILALSSGRFRQMGVSSLAGFLPYANSNELVMDFASRELIPQIQRVPVIFGLHATDPTIDLNGYLNKIKQNGFAGINNFPSVGLMDGLFREALEEAGLGYDQEVKAIRCAHELDLFTVAFVFDEKQAEQMTMAGADIICVHLGLTVGGDLGAKKILSLQTAKRFAQKIFNRCSQINPDVIKMIYGGPVYKPIDVQFMYDGTDIHGYIGGSAFERIPAEQTVIELTKTFKQTGDISYDTLIEKVINGIGGSRDYVDFTKRYVHVNYMEEIALMDIAEILGLSPPYLSSLFKKETGIAFTNYVIEYRLNRAVELMKEETIPLHKVAELVGYPNYEQFSKIFKKYKGETPTNVRNNM